MSANLNQPIDQSGDRFPISNEELAQLVAYWESQDSGQQSVPESVVFKDCEKLSDIAG